MPIGFLTPAERERLSRFPEHIPDDDLFVFFRLSDDDRGVINQQRILDWWDEMLRLTGSLKLGYVTASLMVQKLQSYAQQNASLKLSEFVDGWS